MPQQPALPPELMNALAAQQQAGGGPPPGAGGPPGAGPGAPPPGAGPPPPGGGPPGAPPGLGGPPGAPPGGGVDPRLVQAFAGGIASLVSKASGGRAEISPAELAVHIPQFLQEASQVIDQIGAEEGGGVAGPGGGGEQLTGRPMGDRNI